MYNSFTAHVNQLGSYHQLQLEVTSSLAPGLDESLKSLSSQLGLEWDEEFIIAFQSAAQPGGRLVLLCKEGVDQLLGGTVSEALYATLLHEIGHLVHPLGAVGSQLSVELAAWKWALDNAVVWTEKMDQVLNLGLMSYWHHGPELGLYNVLADVKRLSRMMVEGEVRGNG